MTLYHTAGHPPWSENLFSLNSGKVAPWLLRANTFPLVPGRLLIATSDPVISKSSASTLIGTKRNKNIINNKI